MYQCWARPRSWDQCQCSLFACRADRRIDDPLPGQAKRRIKRTGNGLAPFDAAEDILDCIAPPKRQGLHRHRRWLWPGACLNRDMIGIVMARNRAIGANEDKSASWLRLDGP